MTDRERAIEAAAREGYATMHSTNGPRVLGEYAGIKIMELQSANARVIVDAWEAAMKEAGFVMMPVEPTQVMCNAAIDVDHLRLGDISPLGFRQSPQELFAECYRAMLQARPDKP